MLYFALAIGVIAVILEVISLLVVKNTVIYDTALSKELVEQGEEFFIIVTITNKGVLPVNYLRAIQNIPKSANVDVERITKGISGSTKLQSATLYNKLTCSAYLMPRRKIIRMIPVSATVRGRLAFKQGQVWGGDFLGFSSRPLLGGGDMEATALPKALEDEYLSRMLGGFLGDASVRRFIMEDPVLTIGFRDYTGMEPMKSIAWNQTARTGQIMVKKYDYTLEATATVLLNVERSAGLFEGNIRSYDEDIENCFSITRSVCEELEEKRIKYALRSNVSTPGSRYTLGNVSEGLGTVHLMGILEGLGCATYVKSAPFVNVLADAARAAEQGRTHMLITMSMLDEYTEYIERIEAATGMPVLVLEVSKLCS